jgi:hypothetical protein
MAITLKSPITINIPSITKTDGTTKDFPPVVLNDIDYIVSYDNSRKFASAILKGVNRSITLWSGDDYDKAGQFTDKDVDARVNELLGKNPAATIEGLFKAPTFKKS